MDLSNRIDTKETACTSCGALLDSTRQVDGMGVAPKSGDISICLYCGHILAYNDDLSRRDLTDAEMIEIAGNPKIIAAQKVRAEYQRNKKKSPVIAPNIKEWVKTRPQCVQDLIKKFPIHSVFETAGETLYLVGYTEGGMLIVSPIDPAKHYDEAVRTQRYICADHFELDRIEEVTCADHRIH